VDEKQQNNLKKLPDVGNNKKKKKTKKKREGPKAPAQPVITEKNRKNPR